MTYDLQGLIFAVGALIFAPSLLIMVWNAIKTKTRVAPYLTSIPTAVVLWVFAGTYLTMGSSFVYASITSVLTASMWTLLVVLGEKEHTWKQFEDGSGMVCEKCGKMERFA